MLQKSPEPEFRRCGGEHLTAPRWGLAPYRALARELNFCNGGSYRCGSLAQPINGLPQAEKRPSEGKKPPSRPGENPGRSGHVRRLKNQRGECRLTSSSSSGP